MGELGLTLREATPDDIDEVVAVGAQALGWQPGEPNAELFRWKHLDNPFGPSRIWLAVDEGRIAGYRALMNWGLVDRSGRPRSAVRAVDTATHPDYQRKGIFSRLTRHAVDEITSAGVDLVFNTPNGQSRPGYLKMGWIDVGRLPVAMRPTSARAAIRTLRARVPAEKWSEAVDVGQPASQVLADAALAGLVSEQAPSAGLATALSPQFLRWRYGLEPLQYRAWAPDGLAAGVVLFRVRRRGAARECSIGHVLTAAGDSGRRRQLLTGLARSVDADYLLMLGTPRPPGFVPMPRQGPRLTARRLNLAPPASITDWAFELGDIELF